mmetsp:Transcript_16284/g.47772  ORF Transcript_16284/g.47772 Transcript_16284/m.47772 type:complete len:264 (+) Transcript_16284:997-1788(+)
MGFLLRGRQASAKGGNVLVVPSVAVSNRGAVRNTSDLVPVVPPRHDAGVLGRVVAEPPVGLAVVIDGDLCPIPKLRVEHDRRRGQLLGHVIRILPELPAIGVEQVEHDHDDSQRHEAECRLDGRVPFTDAGALLHGGHQYRVNLVERIFIKSAPASGGCFALVLEELGGGLVLLLFAGRAGVASFARLALGILLALGVTGIRSACGGGQVQELVHRPLHWNADGNSSESRRHRAGEEDETHHLVGEEEHRDSPEHEKVRGWAQ